jgi:flagellar biosynthetic protein FliR
MDAEYHAGLHATAVRQYSHVDRIAGFGVINLTSVQLDTWIAAFFWPFFRILALVATAPFFGARGIPTSTKIGFAFVITVLVAPMIGPLPAVQPASAHGLFIVAQQLMIGFAMGLAIRVIFAAVEMAGHIMGLQMGLGFATFFDPQNSAQIPVVGQFLGVVAMLLFLATNAHLLVITALVESFRVLPIGLHPLAAEGWKTLVLWGGEIFRGGMLIALPVVAVLMMIHIAMAVLTRAAPQMNIFAVGFPLTLAVGFVVISLSLAYILPVFSNMAEAGVQTMMRIASDANNPAAF